MEFIVEQLKMWWQFVLVGVLIFLGYMYDRRYTRTVLTGFSCEKMPCMIPIKIPTKGKGFFGAIWLWLMSVRTCTGQYVRLPESASDNSNTSPTLF